MPDRPSSILFVCSENALRSPMAEALTKHRYGTEIFVDSVGVRDGDLDPLAIAVMDEIGIDLSRHHAKTFDDLEDDYFDIVITLSPEAQHSAIELTRVMACEVEFWNTMDPSLIESEDREVVLDAYRQVRDQLMQRIKDRFPVQTPLDT